MDFISVQFAVLSSISPAPTLLTILSPGISPTVLCTLVNIVTNNSMPGILSMSIHQNVKMNIWFTTSLKAVISFSNEIQRHSGLLHQEVILSLPVFVCSF